ncbi:MAG TPA: alpha/beta fold hydrolase [bacterium]|nr:alpha/beta fold hydrolase [bacterium]
MNADINSDIRHETGKFKGAGELDLFIQSWTPKKPLKNGKAVAPLKPAVIALVHGMAEHSGRYGFPVKYFTSRGYTVYAMDLRGHGESGGRRSYADSFEDLMEDIDRYLEKIRKAEKGKKVFLVGHSFGGQLVLNYGARHPEGLAGIVVSSPNVSLKVRIPIVKRLAAPILSRLVPRLALGNELDPSMVSKDPDVVEAYRRDKKIQKKITTRLADIVLENHLHILELAKTFRVPSLLMHAGDDVICSPDGTKRFFENIPIKDKKFKVYDGFYHELFNEVGRNQVFRDMELWILKRL